MPGVLAEVVRGVDDDAARVDARPHRARRQPAGLVKYVSHDVGVADPKRPGPRLLLSRVRADQAGAVLGDYRRKLGVLAAPAVVDEVGPGRAYFRRDLVPPGIRADHDARVGVADRRDERRDPPGLFGHVHLLAGRRRHAADVDDV